MNREGSASVVLALIAVGLFAVSSPALAQQRGSAGIRGEIIDPQGAAIPGAGIALTSISTNQVRTARSNEQGQYLFPLLPPGEYGLTVEAPGFTAFKRTGILLQVNDELKLDVKLEVGGVATSVVVADTGVSVETTGATIKETVDSRRVVDLPLNGRNLADLTLLVPGVQPATGVTGTVGGTSMTAGQKQFSVNGSRDNNLRYTLDGGDNTDSLNNLNMPFPFPDAVQEFSVQTSNETAEMGKSSGGVVNVVTKSGTNQYHGNGFWFVRNTALNANNFFSRLPDQLRRNQGGFTVGGPIIKDKLFGFGGYQRTWIRQLSGAATALTVPGPFRAGDFSSLLSRTSPVILIDPLSGQPFPNNQIPVARLSPAAQSLLKYSPLPDPDGYTRYVQGTRQDEGQQVVRLDYRPTAKHNLSGRYFRSLETRKALLVPDNIYTVGGGIVSLPSQNATLGHTYVASPSLVADAHFTVVRRVGNRTNGFPKSIADFGVKVNANSSELQVRITGTSGLSSLSTINPAVFARTSFELTHSWRYVKGRHNFVWGVDLEGQRYNEDNVYLSSGRYQFNGRITGFDQADFVLGYMSTFTQGNGEFENRRLHYEGFYGGDSFRIHPRLTLNFGLRWEPYSPMTDLKDRSLQFRPDEYAKGTRSARFLNAPAGLFFPGDKLSGSTVPKAGTGSDLNNLGPRFGFAWDVAGNGRTSVRGGYGIFYDMPQMYMLNNMNTQTPFSQTVVIQGSPTSLLRFDNPYLGRESLNIFPFKGDFDPKTPFDRPFDTTALTPSFLAPYVQDWNLALERKLGMDWLLRVAYVGTKSTHLSFNYDQNPPVYDYTKTLAQNQNTIDARRPFKDYARIIMLTTGLNQNYNSLQVTLNKRFSRGFSLLGSYTWSKNIDYRSLNDAALNGMVLNPFNFFYARGPADNDHRHRLVTSVVWNVPDAGKRFQSRVLSAILGNWQASGIITMQSGSPFSIANSGDRAAGMASGGGDGYGDLVGTLELPNNRSRGEKIAQYFNTSAVAQPAPGSFGNLGRNVIYGPGYFNTDFSISRSVPLRFRESARLVFRSEYFNLFNHPQLGNPGSRIGSSSFGRISSANPPRIL